MGAAQPPLPFLFALRSSALSHGGLGVLAAVKLPRGAARGRYGKVALLVSAPPAVWKSVYYTGIVATRVAKSIDTILTL